MPWSASAAASGHFPLLARMVKPWPGIVDVEPMPAEEADEATPEDAGEAES